MDTHAPAFPARAVPPQLQDYLRRGLQRIDGWLTPLDAALVGAVAGYQVASGLSGSVGEIGIHHGRTFMVVALSLTGGERAFAVDVFADQHLNRDRSGRGDEAIFRANLAEYGVAADQVAVLRQDSLGLTWPAIAGHVGQPARLASVDGGHTAEVVEHDLAMMEDGLAEHGVIVLDDYFTAEFPGVSEGAARFLISRTGRIVPFALGDSRMLLCRPDWADAYRAAARTGAADKLVRDAALWGGTVDVYRTPRRLMHRIRRLRIARALRDHPIGLRLKPVLRRFLKD